jgi:gamma-glutamylcyclotransferase (GGCT)/AIG2-like uncharacterized protein YtfP
VLVDLFKKILITELNGILTHYNRAGFLDEPVEKYLAIFYGLNLLWTDANNHDLLSSHNGGDKNMFKSLLKILDNTNEGKCFVISDALKRFIEFRPKVMDMHVLATGHYNPSGLDNDLKTKAEEKHTALIEGYSKFLRGEKSQADFLDLVADLMYTIRSNISHGEKTVSGPDTKQVERDRLVSEAAFPVADLLMKIFLGISPGLLATYGTLMKEEILERLSVSAKEVESDFFIQGKVCHNNGLNYFKWRADGDRVKVKIYDVRNPEADFKKLQKYEGEKYRLIHVPLFESGGQLVSPVAVYQLNTNTYRDLC